MIRDYEGTVADMPVRTPPIRNHHPISWCQVVLFPTNWRKVHFSTPWPRRPAFQTARSLRQEKRVVEIGGRMSQRMLSSHIQDKEFWEANDKGPQKQLQRCAQRLACRQVTLSCPELCSSPTNINPLWHLHIDPLWHLHIDPLSHFHEPILHGHYFYVIIILGINWLCKVHSVVVTTVWRSAQWWSTILSASLVSKRKHTYNKVSPFWLILAHL